VTSRADPFNPWLASTLLAETFEMRKRILTLSVAKPIQNAETIPTVSSKNMKDSQNYTYDYTHIHPILIFVLHLTLPTRRPHFTKVDRTILKVERACSNIWQAMFKIFVVITVFLEEIHFMLLTL
jgi:hypothetical protein